MIKQFFIWLGWRKEVGFARFLFGLYGSIFFLIFPLCLFWRPGFLPPEAPIWALVCVALLWAYGPFVFVVIVIAIGYGTEKRNWRITVDNAQKLLSFENQNYHPIITRLVNDVKQTKNSTKLAEWMEKYRKLKEARETFKYLEEQRGELSKQIDQKIQDIKILETALKILS